MKKIVYLPLDERPCNNTFCQFLAQNNNEINLVCPPLSILGLKKKPADYQKIAAFLTEQCADADRFACLAVTHCGRHALWSSSLFSRPPCLRRFLLSVNSCAENTVKIEIARQ